LQQPLLDKVGLRGERDAYPARLSGGQKQPIAIGALAMRPPILQLQGANEREIFLDGCVIEVAAPEKFLLKPESERTHSVIEELASHDYTVLQQGNDVLRCTQLAESLRQFPGNLERILFQPQREGRQHQFLHTHAWRSSTAAAVSTSACRALAVLSNLSAYRQFVQRLRTRSAVSCELRYQHGPT
jgi:ABC-type microcin C transport system duplicated ATPase subunit YejF